MSKFDLSFSHPLMNAAGILGYIPDPYGPVDLSSFGAFITNPISREARTPAHGGRVFPFPGGFLLHTGYPNPGLRAALRRYTLQWTHSSLPVIVHVLSGKVEEVGEMVSMLERVDGLLAVEVGLPPEVDPAAAAAFARAACGELPVIVRLPFEHCLELARALAGVDIAAVSLAPPRGAAQNPPGNLVHGRLYGSALFPQSLEAVHAIAQSGMPVIGAGGISSQEQVDAMLSAGALAAQVDSVLWRGGWKKG
jgi:dihydroorotate dehydrogenase (NAD+) catalytic subunit